MIVDKKGFTLLELLIALIILGIVVGAAVAYQLNASRFFINPSIIRSQIQNNASIALAHISQQIRQVQYVSFSPSGSTITLSGDNSNTLTLQPDGTTYSISTDNKLIFESEAITERIDHIDLEGKQTALDGFKAVEITLVTEEDAEAGVESITLVTSVYCREVVSPTVDGSGINPKQGKRTEVTEDVTIPGNNFIFGASVYFGGELSPSVTVISSSELQADAPIHTVTGAVDVVVVNPDGGFGVADNAFVYQAGGP